MIKYGRRLFASVKNLVAGDLITFGYNGTIRTGVVISPDWKGNVDCYVFDDLDSVSEELLTHILQTSYILDSGDLYVDFGNEFDFKSFGHNSMLAIQQVEYYFDEEKPEQPKPKVEEKVEEVKEMIQDIYIDTGNLYGE